MGKFVEEHDGAFEGLREESGGGVNCEDGEYDGNKVGL